MASSSSSSSARRMNGPWRTLTLALLVITSLTHDGVAAQDDVVTGPTAAVETMPFIRGDMIESEAMTNDPDSEVHDFQIKVFPTVWNYLFGSTEFPDAEADLDLTTAAAAAGGGEEGGEAGPEIVPPRGDQPETPPPSSVLIPGPDQPDQVVLAPEGDVMCVTKEKIQDRDTVSLTLRSSSTCEETKLKIESVLEHLCGEDCKLEVYQEDNSNQILISGPYIDDDAEGMAEKFNNDNIKDKVEVEDAVPRWGKSSKMVLVSLLLTGLLLAALLVAGYYLKTHRGKTAKGVRLAESFQVDEENQANTLVSVAPLQPQEPLDKPTVNGEPAPDDAKSPPTNGHSANQAPVADTEM